MKSTLLALLPVTLLATACIPTGQNTVPAPLLPPTTTGTVTPPPKDPIVPPQTFPTQTAQPQDLAFPDEDFRRTQPVAGPLRPFALPAMKPFTLKNGLKVYLVERHDLPLISVELNFDGGALADPAGKEGLAGVCMDLVTEGTASLDKIAFAAALADTASSISSYASDDSQGVAMDTLSTHFDSTLTLFADSVRTPGLRAPDLERLVARRIESVKQSKGSAASIAGRVQSPIYYGADSPEGAVVTEVSLAAITLADCQRYAKAWLQPKGARLFVVGDLTEAQIRTAFDGGAFAGFTGKAPALAKIPRPRPMPGRIFFVNVPGSAQSQVSLLHAGPARKAKDYFANSLMSAILGGGFSSRINMNLREDKGYSYGARGAFSYTQRGSMFSAGSSVRTDASYQSVLELQREVKSLQTGASKISEAEIARERQGAILGLPARFATGGSSLGAFRGLVYFGLPLNYYDTFVAKMGKLTAAQLDASAKAHLQVQHAQYLVVGDGDAAMIIRDGKTDKPLMRDGTPVTLRQALGELATSNTLGVGGLVELDADGNVVK